MEQQKNFAVLIDADNVSPERFERIFGEISLWGNATYRRIYGNWAEYNRAALKEKLVEFGLTPVQQFNYIKGKNATDIALVIDAMDILYTGKVDGFAIVTNDSDFTRLALRLRESGMTVIGMGDDVAPAAFRAACSDFIVLRESRRIAEELSAQKTLRLVSRRSGRFVRRSEEVPDNAPADNEAAPAAAVPSGEERRPFGDRKRSGANNFRTAEAAQDEVPVSPRQMLSDRELREDIKSILTDNVDNDGWLSASTLVNMLKARHEDLDIKDYEHLPLFAGKRKIWTTYFLSLGFCESLQKGPSNYQLRIRAEERKKVLEERANRGDEVKAEKAAPAAEVKDEVKNEVKAEVKAEAKPADKPGVKAEAAAEKPATANATAAANAERAPGQGRRRNRRGRKPAANGAAEVKAEAEAEVKAETKAEVKEEAKAEVKAEVKAEEPKAEAKAEAPKKTTRRRRTATKVAETAKTAAEKVTETAEKAKAAAETAKPKQTARKRSSAKTAAPTAAAKAEKTETAEAEAPKKTTRRRRTAAKPAADAGEKAEKTETGKTEA